MVAGCCHRKMKETSCLLGAEPVAGKSTVKEAIHLCKNPPHTNPTGLRRAVVYQPIQRFPSRVKFTEFGIKRLARLRR